MYRSQLLKRSNSHNLEIASPPYELHSTDGFALLILGKWLTFAKILKENSKRSVFKTSEENVIKPWETSDARQNPLNGKSFPWKEPHYSFFSVDASRKSRYVAKTILVLWKYISNGILPVMRWSAWPMEVLEAGEEEKPCYPGKMMKAKL